MTNQRFALKAALAAAGLSVAAIGCILGSNPNENSVVFGSLGGANGGAGTTGTGQGGAGGISPIVGTALATFDTTDTGTMGFALDDYADTAQTNLNAAASTSKPTLTFDGAEGSPAAGSLKIVAPYSGASQYVDIQKQLGQATMPASLQDWSGGKMHVRIKVDAGSTFGGGVQAYVKTTGAYVFGGTFTNLAKNNTWQEFILNVDSPMTRNGGYDATKVISYGLQLNTGSAGTGATPVNFHIDSFSLEGGHLPPPPAPDAGTDTPPAAVDTGTSATDTGTDTAAPADATGN
jgi:hypothetical protein